MAEVLVGIQELIIVSLDLSVEKFLRRAERFFENLSRNDVLVFRAYECRTFAGLDVLEIHHAEYLAVLFERAAFSEIACYHKLLLGNIWWVFFIL